MFDVGMRPVFISLTGVGGEENADGMHFKEKANKKDGGKGRRMIQNEGKVFYEVKE